MMSKFLVLMLRVQFVLVTMVLLSNAVATAQPFRQFDVNDSTFYTLNADTTIVAGKRKLYTLDATGLSLIHNFTLPDTNFFIRDFDILDDDTWYTLMGSRYIGNTTLLYRTDNGGASWHVDSSYYAAAVFYPGYSNYNSLNRVQVLGNDTVALFVGYYDSGIVYSLDGGSTWQPWFSNLIAHYHGMFLCRDSVFLFGLEGDAFNSMMFSFPRHLLFSPDTNNAWTNYNPFSYHPACYNNVAGCIYPPWDSLTYISHFNFFKQIAAIRCTLTSANAINRDAIARVQLYPSPVRNTLNVKVDAPPDVAYRFSIVNTLGKVVHTFYVHNTSALVDVTMPPPGVYFLQSEPRIGHTPLVVGSHRVFVKH